LIGQTLGNFEVLSKLGEGGMGEVYRARDQKLGREVALKVLPREMSGDPERIARFQREARTLATLQHPNVASVYGFEETAQARFLVMELVEGEDLAERLKRGALPVEDTLAIARQIAEGLEAAHEKNIVHRDLKPANVKVDPEGKVKILDFGLARAYTGDPDAEEDLANSPTITAAMTQAGTILGTAAYMSPEQAKGKNVDKRADIWAFGAIVFEMLSGERLFEAETISETLASVLLTHIDWDRLPSDTPPSLRALLERCLQKDPKLRLRDVGEARIVLADPTATIALQVAMGEPETRKRPVWPWAAAIAVALVAGIVGGRLGSPTPPPEELPPLLFEITSAGRQLVVGSLAISPNGEHLVFAQRDSTGARHLFIRRLDEEQARLLPGTQNGLHPFWSPDSRSLGFFIGNNLFRASLDGSAASQIAELSRPPLGGSWNEDGVILIGAQDGPIVRTDAAGGSVGPATELAPQIEEAHCWPQFLPDGEHFIFLADASSDEGHRLYVHSLDGREKKILVKGLRSAILVDPRGGLMWSDSGQLFTRPFDLARREFSGPRILVQDRVSPFNQRHELPATISWNGILGTQTGSDESVISRMSLADGEREVLLPPGQYRNPRLSPDGTLLTFEFENSSQERIIWVQDLARGTRTRISDLSQVSDSAMWHPDGQTVYFCSAPDGDWQVYRKRVYGGGAPEPVGRPEGTTDLGANDISPDGKWILVVANPIDGWDYWLGRLDEEETTWTPWLTSAAAELQGRFSPDSRWIAYQSSTSGESEVYVSPLEGGPEELQLLVSVNGGSDPAWSHDGSAVFYRDPAGTLMRVDVNWDSDRPRLSAPVELFELVPPSVGWMRNAYDLEPGGESLIAFLETSGRTPSIRIRTGWMNR
jgi:serine/threonine protein kinase